MDRQRVQIVSAWNRVFDSVRAGVATGSLIRINMNQPSKLVHSQDISHNDIHSTSDTIKFCIPAGTKSTSWITIYRNDITPGGQSQCIAP
ncbi:MAG: hypothetical protein VX669_12950, partial [Planctomycetota bacterium]|nr:hypothetical protein [Planctomycetota bacterium]